MSNGANISVTRARNIYYKIQQQKYSPNKLSYFDRLCYLQNGTSSRISYNRIAEIFVKDNKAVIRKAKARAGNRPIMIKANRLPTTIIR